MKKTQEEIKALKDNWLKDPCWELETEEGFEDHVEELLNFRRETEAEWQAKAEERIARRARVIAIDTGIVNATVAQSLHTYAEIEDQINKNNDADNQPGLEAAHARATLLLAAQLQRVADTLESLNESSEADSRLQFMTNLYKG